MSGNRIKNWRLPLTTDKQATATDDYLMALSQAKDGFYPIGENQIWHGGIHLNDNVITTLGGQTLGCITEGEVIAYRIDSQYPNADYGNDVKAVFSSGFTLVKHTLEIPQLPAISAAESEGSANVTLNNNPLMPAADTQTDSEAVLPENDTNIDRATAINSGSLPDNTPSVESTKTPSGILTNENSPITELNLYSLYMHLSDWKSYQDNPKLVRPGYWQSSEYSVGEKAKDKIPGCVIRQNGSGTAILAILPRGACVHVGEPIKVNSPWCKLTAIVTGTTIPPLTRETLPGYVYVNEMTQSPVDAAMYTVAEKGNDKSDLALGLNVRETPSSKGNWLSCLARGTKLAIGELGGKNNQWGKIERVIEGQVCPTLEKNETGRLKGWVYLGELDIQPAKPQKLDDIVVLDTPYAIKTGELVGYPGLYQKLTDAKSGIAPAPMVHFELFSCDDVLAVVSQSRARAAKLDITHKNMLLVHKEAILHKPVAPDRTVESDVELTLIKNSKSSGCWTEVCTEKSQIYALIIERNKLGKYSAGQYETKQESSKKAIQTLMSKIGEFVDINDIPDLVTFDRKYYHDTDNSKSMPSPTNGHGRRGIIFTIAKRSSPFWVNHVDVNEQGKRTALSAIINAWTTYPLQKDKNTLEVKTGLACLLSSSATKQKSKAEWAIDDEGKAWWFIHSADDNGQDINGWIKEELPTATRQSSWEWPLFELVTETATPKQQLDRMNRGVMLDEVDWTPLMKALYKIIDIDKDNALSSSELKQALTKPWLADQISRLTVNYESEWFADEALSKWNALDDLFADRLQGYTQEEKDQYLAYWQAEKTQRIKKLLWWDQLAGKHGLSADGKAWHFHPVGLVGNFCKTAKLELITLEMLQAVNPSGTESSHKVVLTYLNKYAQLYGLTKPKAIAHFLSQIGHESGFRILSENLNYSASQMKKTFGCSGGPSKYDKQTDSCSTKQLRPKLWTNTSNYANSPENLGNYVYANRMGNGNETSGDGYKYRGRGMIQITGKDAYQNFQNIHNRNNPDDIKDFVSNPELVISAIEYGVESAFVFWTTKSGKPDSTFTTSISLHRLAETGTIRQVTQLVNGGQNGYTDRKNRFNRVAPILRINKEE